MAEHIKYLLPINEPLSFSFKIQPLGILYEALCHCDFKRQDNALIEVGPNAFYIIVVGKVYKVLEILVLGCTALIDFTLHKPLTDKLINLSDLFHHLLAAKVHDSITISHVDGSNHLSFEFGTHAPRRFSLELMDNYFGIGGVPVISNMYGAAFPSGDLTQNAQRHGLDSLELNTADFVSFCIDDGTVTVKSGVQPWPLNYVDKDIGIWRKEAGQNHQIEFQWIHSEVFHLVRDDPPNNITMNINIGEAMHKWDVLGRNLKPIKLEPFQPMKPLKHFWRRA